MALIVPAVLPSSRADLFEKLALFMRLPHVSRVQIDVVDGKFAAPASWPYADRAELDALREESWMLPYAHRLAYEIDLMCYGAEEAAGAWLAFGASRLTFHAETITDLPRFFVSLRKRYGGGADLHIPRHVVFGLALSPATDLALIDGIAHELSYVQLMGIARIGRQGEPFDARTISRVRKLRQKHPALPIQVDGGVSLAHARELLAQGVSDLIVGSGIVRADDPVAAFAAYEALRSPFGV